MQKSNSLWGSLRIEWNCFTNDNDFLQNSCYEYKRYLQSQNYPKDLVDKQFDKALSISRSELLSKKVKPDKKVFPLVLDHNPILPDIKKNFQRAHPFIIHSSPQIKEIFPSKSVFPDYRRTKKLKGILAPSKLRSAVSRDQGKVEGVVLNAAKNVIFVKKFLTSGLQIPKLGKGSPIPYQTNFNLLVQKCYLFS